YYYLRGLAYAGINKFEQALADYTRVLELTPPYGLAYHWQGLAYAEISEFEQAITYYTRKLELNSSDGDTYYYLKVFEQTIADYKRMLGLNSSYVGVYYNRGLTYLYLKDIALARDDHKRHLDLEPKDITTAWLIEWMGMSRQHADEKIAERLEAIAAFEPEDYIAYVCRSVALGLRGKGKEGLAEMEKAILLEPIGWSAYFWKGMLLLYYYRGVSRDRDALVSIEQALALGLPPILLTPLYWFEHDRPDLFEKELRLLLERYGV
ncbi:MAG TPA: tetratricopeptide repeat protein, partial [Ktedonobacteraceae bacterium]|nr:tetratricopeptide repeat protein [Ktedonobacteraceae bacterium]